MAEFPALPLFVDAYMLDCGHLTDAEHGRYLQILMQLWIAPQQRLPNDDEWLARKFRRTPEEVRRDLRPLCSEFCQVSGNWITQKRLSKVFEHVKATSKKQSDRAKARWYKDKDVSHGNADVHRSGNATAMQDVHRSGNASNPIQSNPKESSSSHPPQPVPSAFDEAERMLRKIPGIEKHPVAVSPVIAPIWQLVQQGYDLRRQIIPSILRQIANRPAGSHIKNWKFFVPGIIDDSQPATATNGHAVMIDDAKWLRMLEIGRDKQQWQVERYGPIPGHPGCRVPPHLLKDGDGEGWTVWRPER